MIFDLGQSLAQQMEWIRVTAEYSNAVLVAILPHISDVAHKLDLPIPKPQVSRPAVPGIPRYMFYWYYSRPGDEFTRSAISAEVDADKGKLKSLYIGDLASSSNGPKIDVPFLLPPETNAASSQTLSPSRMSPRSPPRPLTPFPAPQK